MKIKSLLFIPLFIFLLSACVSTKSTLMNVDDNAPIPKLTKENTFVITEYSKDKKYGYHPNYPINIFYKNTLDENSNPARFFNALTGPKGEKIVYIKTGNCCPFPTKKSEMGAGFLSVYEITWEGLKKPIVLYLNLYEKGKIAVPIGFELKK